MKGPLTMESLLYIYGLQHGAKLLDFLGRREDGDLCRKRAEAVQKALLTHCLGNNGMLQDGREWRITASTARCLLF